MSDLIERLRAIPVWMVRDMSPGWQDHGTTAYQAADEITALREAYSASVAFIESHVADPDITNEMAAKYAEYQRVRAAHAHLLTPESDNG